MCDSGVMMRWVTPLVLVLLVGCGGKTKTHPHSDDAGGDGRAGSSLADGSGGTRATGGARATGDTRATGGARTTGGSRATGGTPSVGGQADPPCPATAPVRGGECDTDLVCSYITATKDCCNETATATCVDGAWSVAETDCDCPEATGGTATGTGGSAGSGADGGAGGFSGAPGAAGALPDEWFECEQSDDCIVSSESCCGQCGAYTSEDVIATNRESLSSYVEARCGASFACDACAAGVLPSITAVCRGGRCTVVDLSQDPMTACVHDDDCRVRTKDCCECGGHLLDLVAIATSAASSYDHLVCEEGIGCDPCLPSYTLTAACDDGHCVVELL